MVDADADTGAGDGAGDVGCCPEGQKCSGVIGRCAEGYTACSGALGGGCCIPGYECVRGGCTFPSFLSSVVVVMEV